MSIFGQKPADLVDALLKSKNFSDVPDKAAARTNLDVPSKSDVLYSGVPIGTIIAYYGTIAPTGYLPCAGQTINSASFPDLVEFLNPSGSTATIPDLRGEFLRGLDSGRGVDLGRVLGSAQKGSLIIGDNGVGDNILVATDVAGRKTQLGLDSIVAGDYTGATLKYTATTAMSVLPGADIPGHAGASRPRNVSVLYCIKAYNAVSNYVSDLNLSGLVGDYSALMASAVKYADFIGSNKVADYNGYQKLPGGLIIQWGYFTMTAQAQVIPFNITYPMQSFAVVPFDQASAGISTCAIGVTALTQTGFTVYSIQGSTATPAGAAGYVAIGY